MTSSSKRNRSIVFLGLIVAVVALIMAIARERSSSREAKEAANRVSNCQKLAAKVESLRGSINGLDLVADRNYHPGDRIATGMKGAGLSSESLGVSVQAGRSIKESSLQERRILLPPLKEVSLESIIRFASALLDDKPRLHLNLLSVTASPKNDVPGDTPSTWDATFDFSFFVPAENTNSRR